MLKGLTFILKHMRRREIRPKICPNCGSRNIHKVHSFEWLFPSKYLCEECGYEGYIVLEISKDEE